MSCFCFLCKLAKGHNWIGVAKWANAHAAANPVSPTKKNSRFKIQDSKLVIPSERSDEGSSDVTKTGNRVDSSAARSE